MEGSGRRWRVAIAGGGERSEAEGSDPWSGAIAGGRKRPEVEESSHKTVLPNLISQSSKNHRTQSKRKQEGCGRAQATIDLLQNSG